MKTLTEKNIGKCNDIGRLKSFVAMLREGLNDDMAKSTGNPSGYAPFIAAKERLIGAVQNRLFALGHFGNVENWLTTDENRD